MNDSRASNREAKRDSRSLGYALTWALPLPLWQLVFFIAPLLFLAALTFWTVQSFRLVPDFDSVNWVKVYGASFFLDALLRHAQDAISVRPDFHGCLLMQARKNGREEGLPPLATVSNPWVGPSCRRSARPGSGAG